MGMESSVRSSMETMETFRHLNRIHDVKLVIALVMPGGRYEASERSPAEMDERIQEAADSCPVEVIEVDHD